MSKIIDIKRMQRIRKKLKSVNKNRFRLSIYRSSKNISAQNIVIQPEPCLLSSNRGNSARTVVIQPEPW